ncbi:MAG: hypothetical protein K2H92_10715 [Bacteroidaceae bacterium]|nr:hypothetical protein [Bacteroidaceae bacterium]
MSPTSTNRSPRLRPTDVGDSDLEAVGLPICRIRIGGTFSDGIVRLGIDGVVLCPCTGNPCV